MPLSADLIRSARIAQISLNEVDAGLIEAARAMGMVNASAMADGLGELAIGDGYERDETHVVFEVIVILIAWVPVLQFAGEWLAARIAPRGH